MKKKTFIPNWKFWDWKSIKRIALIVFIISVGCLALIYSSNWLTSRNQEKHTEITNAIILDVQPIKYVDLTVTGNKMRLHGYEVTYQYKVDTISYVGRYFTKSFNIALDAKQKIDQNILVKYNPDRPKKSILYIEKAN